MRNLPAFFILLLCMLLALTLHAQNTKYRKTYLQPWEFRPEFEHSIDSLFQDEDAVVLSEFTEWRMNDRQNTTLVTRRSRIKILTPQGAELAGRINVPPSVDPAADYSDVPINRRGIVHRPKYFDLDITYFHARILKPNGQLKIISPQDSIQTETLQYNNSLRFAYSYHFFINGLQPGDILETEYSYYLPFLFDWQRIFFNGTMPVQQYTLQITAPAREYLVLHLANGAFAPDTLKSTDAPDFNITLRWKLQNLPGCLLEPGARPNADLPHLVYYAHNKVYGIWQNDQIVKFKPYSWSYFAYDMVSFKHLNVQKTRRRLSAKEVALNQFFQKQTADIDAQKPLQRLMKIHETIANNFNYQSDSDPFATTDKRMAKISSVQRELILREMNRNQQYQGPFNRISFVPYTDVITEGYFGLTDAKLEKVGQSLSGKYLLNINRYSIYEGLLTRLGEDYYRVLVSDKRIGQLNPDTCLPIFGGELLYAVKNEGNLFYLFPKNRRFGYELNELPFYLEDATSLHLWQMADNHNNPETLHFYQTPISLPEQNYRITNVKAAVNLSNKQINFEDKLSLSGQYSTIIREFYQHNTTDSTVNERYYHHFAKISPNTKIVAKQELTHDIQYPFKAEMRANYSDNSLITQLNDTVYHINLKNWIQHIFNDDFTPTRKRFLPYYPDFTGTDTYHYYLEFDRPITIANFKDLPLEINNSFGTYFFNIEQQSSNILLIHSVFTVSAGKLEPEQANLAAQIYNIMKQVEKATLTVTCLPAR